MKFPPLNTETPRLLLRNLKVSDASALFEIISLNKNSLKDYFPFTVQGNSSVMDARAFIRVRNREAKSGESFTAGIFLKENKQLLGLVSLKHINWRVPKCEMGYFIDKKQQGKGLCTEATNANCAYSFDVLKMAKISLRIEPVNIASKRIAEKCGFTFIGLAKNDFRSANDRLMDCEIWERISQESIV